MGWSQQAAVTLFLRRWQFFERLPWVMANCAVTLASFVVLQVANVIWDLEVGTFGGMYIWFYLFDLDQSIKIMRCFQNISSRNSRDIRYLEWQMVGKLSALSKQTELVIQLTQCCFEENVYYENISQNDDLCVQHNKVGLDFLFSTSSSEHAAT